jgi:tRNA(Ile)-lysidine synthase
LKKFLAHIERLQLFQPGETVVVAVSGGADSVALLDILSKIAQGRLHLVVAHLNHGLRGEDSDGDQAFVAQLAASYRLPFAARRAEVAAIARSKGLSLEDAGRQERYRFFAEVARDYNAGSIALAHHRDDQAETVLMRLLRGSGAAGLSAMGSVQGMLKRPLLQVSRKEIEQYLSCNMLTFRTDSTNADTTILRNSIRHELMPLLARYNPKVSERLAATAEILAGDEELLEGLTEAAYQRCLKEGPQRSVLDLDQVVREPRALRLRLYRRALRELRGDLHQIGLSHLESIDRLALAPRPNARIKLPGDCNVARSYQVLNFSGAIPEQAVGAFQVAIEGEGDHPLPGGARLSVALVKRPASLDPGAPQIVYFDPASAPFPWLVRSFQPGDRFRPLGMTGAQKLKELFINEKLAPEQRRRVPLVLSRGRIVWVCGHRISDDAKVPSTAEQVLRVEILTP